MPEPAAPASTSIRLGKRDRYAVWAERAGVPLLLETLPRRNVLLVLNFHRIGDPGATPYDPDPFSATPDEFDAYLRALKRAARVAALDEALAMIEGTERARGAAVLLTFDDGYRDNFDLAFPILRSHGMPAVFFLPTSFIGTNRLPWWDAIAYLVKHSRNPRVRLTYPHTAEFSLAPAAIKSSLRNILGMYRLPGVAGSRFISAVAAACAVEPRAEGADRVFLSWEEAGTMLKGGMAIGSHSHSHEPLAKLSAAEQLHELTLSRNILERRLGIGVTTLAYPVGEPDTYNADTITAAQTAGYRAAFSYSRGVNVRGSMDRFRLLRCPVGRQRPELFRFQVLTTLTAKTFWP